MGNWGRLPDIELDIGRQTAITWLSSTSSGGSYMCQLVLQPTKRACYLPFVWIKGRTGPFGPQNQIVSGAATGAGPENFAISPDGEWVVSLDMERSLITPGEPLFSPYYSLTLFKLDLGINPPRFFWSMATYFSQSFKATFAEARRLAVTGVAQCARTRQPCRLI